MASLLTSIINDLRSLIKAIDAGEITPGECVRECTDVANRVLSISRIRNKTEEARRLWRISQNLAVAALFVEVEPTITIGYIVGAFNELLIVRGSVES